MVLLPYKQTSQHFPMLFIIVPGTHEKMKGMRYYWYAWLLIEHLRMTTVGISIVLKMATI